MSGSPPAGMANRTGFLLKTCSETMLTDDNSGILLRPECQRIFVIIGRVDR